MLDILELLTEDAPDRLFTLGGGCDADVPGIVYMNEKYHGELTVLWLDAHGDLNTPGTSSSALFYGMPLRSVMHESCFGLLENRLPLRATQVIHIGGRDLDTAEEAFLHSPGSAATAFRTSVPAEYRKTPVPVLYTYIWTLMFWTRLFFRTHLFPSRVVWT